MAGALAAVDVKELTGDERRLLQIHDAAGDVAEPLRIAAVERDIDALDAVERIAGTNQSILSGICSGGILAAIAWANASHASGDV